jgi:fructose-1,6-bisphosphatase/inositol monophosphatase family enzyme
VAIPSAWNPASGAFVRRICETSVVRSLGCATLHLMLVATGGVDGTFMNNCKLWDIAAGWLIAGESGALATQPDGAALFPIDDKSYRGAEMPTLAASPSMHAALSELWRAAQ